MRFKQSIRIGDNVTDILKLTCVTGVRKCDDKQGFEWLEYDLTDGSIAEKSDWLCEDYSGHWYAFDNDEYINLTKNN